MRTEEITQALVITDYYIFSAAEENFFEVCLQSSPSSINIALLLTLCHESSTDENTHPTHCQWQISTLAWPLCNFSICRTESSMA